MVALCIPVAPLVMAPSRRVVYQAGAPRNALRYDTLRVRRRQVVKARQPSMIFGLQRMFNWLTPTDIGAAVICTYFVIRRLRMIDSDPTANVSEEEDEDGAVNRGNKLFKKLSGANYNYVAQSDEDLAALRTMTCKKCGFTIFVAKDRLKRHFVKGLECLQCGAKAPDFYNENDPDDPVNFEGATVESADGYKPDPVKIAQRKAEIEAAELAELAALAAEKEQMSNYDPVDEDVDDMAPAPVAEAAPVAVVEAPAPAPAPAPKPPVDDDIFGELGI
jgi:hypothetical protein